MTFVRRQTAYRMRHCCARRIDECPVRRELLRTSTRWAERHPQGVCRIRKVAEPPTAAQQRIIEAEANRIAMLNAASPRAGSCIPEAQKSFEPETANQKPFSWGSKGDILFCERGWPLCPRRPQAAYPLALVRRKGAFSHVRECSPFPRSPRQVGEFSEKSSEITSASSA